MVEIKAHGWHASKSIAIVEELKQNGYVLGEDFDWEYHKPKHSDTTYELLYNRYTVFRFYKDELATWFSLTYL